MSETVRTRLPVAAAAIVVVAVGAVLLVPMHPEAGVLRLLASALPAGSLDGGSRAWWALENFGNVALFVPVGVVAALIFAPRRALLVAIGFSAFCETAQLVIPSRSASLQDIVMNSIGAAIGVGVTVLVRSALRRHRASATNPHSVHAQ